MLAGFLGGVYESPYLVEGHGGGHLDGGVLAVFHGVETHGRMVVPVGGYVHKVDVVALNKLLPCVFRTAVCGGALNSRSVKDFLAFLNIGAVKVAQSHNLGAGNFCETGNSAGTAHAQTDESHSYCVDGVGSEANHVLLTGGALRHIGCNHRRMAAACAR